jgi:hypothetical protein
MKKNQNIIYAVLAGLLLFTACQEETVEPADVIQISFYHPDKNKADSLVTEAAVGKVLTVKVNTNADLCTFWPAGDRLTVKKNGQPAVDSIDVYGKPVLVRSDDFRDYGSLFARGKVMTGSKFAGYSFKYTYTKAGTYKIVLVATVHGISSDDYQNKIIEQTLVVK